MMIILSSSHHKISGRHKARPTVEWREELKIRDKAKQLEGLVQVIMMMVTMMIIIMIIMTMMIMIMMVMTMMMMGLYTQGMPEYKEPEKLAKWEK